jgi:hypothetical protein
MSRTFLRTCCPAEGQGRDLGWRLPGAEPAFVAEPRVGLLHQLLPGFDGGTEVCVVDQFAWAHRCCEHGPREVGGVAVDAGVQRFGTAEVIVHVPAGEEVALAVALVLPCFEELLRWLQGVRSGGEDARESSASRCWYRMVAPL